MTVRDLQILDAEGRIYHVGDVIEGSFTVGADCRATTRGPHRIVQASDDTLTLEPVVYEFRAEVATGPRFTPHQGTTRAERRARRR